MTQFLTKTGLELGLTKIKQYTDKVVGGGGDSGFYAINLYYWHLAQSFNPDLIGNASDVEFELQNETSGKIKTAIVNFSTASKYNDITLFGGGTYSVTLVHPIEHFPSKFRTYPRYLGKYEKEGFIIGDEPGYNLYWLIIHYEGDLIKLGTKGKLIITHNYKDSLVRSVYDVQYLYKNIKHVEDEFPIMGNSSYMQIDIANLDKYTFTLSMDNGVTFIIPKEAVEENDLYIGGVRTLWFNVKDEYQIIT